MAEAVTGNEFLDKLLGETAPAASQPRRGQNYNYPQRLYLKPDGTVVSLQGDPQNRAYYQDKGFRMLSETPLRSGMSEADQYRREEYPKLLKEQREKAALINAIRRVDERNPGLGLQTSFDDESIEEIRDYLADIKARTGQEIQVILPRKRQAREDAADAALLRGVETSATESLEEVANKVIRSQGYDPIDQANKRAK
jgi:hypothetical protein